VHATSPRAVQTWAATNRAVVGTALTNFFIYILKIILKKYTTISKFYTFDIHSTWPMAVSVLTAMGHDG
jgi:hypothetical protein